MKLAKKILNLFMIVGTVICSTFGVSDAKPIKKADSKELSIVSKASASDKVYLSYASEATNKVTNVMHYSHRSHSSHYSHRSHYSSY